MGLFSIFWERAPSKGSSPTSQRARRNTFNADTLEFVFDLNGNGIQIS
jgi:hypothetical protein